ncbi:MAG: tRNA dihydrouridine(20/20a) synthase DusA [Pseudomonadota bacterium]
MTDPRAPHAPDRRLSVAPMMEWTDRHCRYLHRLISRRTLLYTEMVGAAAVTHGPRARLLDFSAAERPVALQLGGSDPAELAEAVRIASDWGYDEINLNVGCPSDRVQSGAFGACLMREPDLVARCAAAMIEASDAVGGPEITVKCRIGVDEQDPAEALPLFIERVSAAGVRSFAVHARKAWLQGLSPKENRDVPPLDYPLALRMKARWPELEIVLNGGIAALDAAAGHIAEGFDGAMIGRAAYHAPFEILGEADARIFGDERRAADPADVVAAMERYAADWMQSGGRANAVTRHMLGLFAGRPGARRYRRVISEAAHRVESRADLAALFRDATAPVLREAA